MSRKRVSREEVETCVVRSLRLVAPEVDIDEIDRDALLREEVEIDSMDFLRFLVNIDERLGVEVPEEDYEKLSSLNSCIDYFEANANKNRD